MKPIACTLGPRDLAAQQSRWRALTIEAREETSDGIRIAFAPDVERELHELVAVENECCAWARWTVEGTELTVSSSGEGIAAARQLFAPR
jgi:hypothetical protein